MWTYTYDANGNLQSVKKNGEVEKSYGYTDSKWKDKLTSFNGSAITYDAIGNPLQYRNGMTFTWSNGRKLASVTQNGATTTFTYDGEGNRIRKVSGNLTVDYIVIGGTIYGEIRTVNNTTTKLHYLFDENGVRIGFVVDGEDSYYYRFNLQGDVTGIFNASGTLVAQYAYDAWGNLIDSDNTAIGLLNPIRYRGYYYDAETGFYYLQTRYYDPVTCRFINADGIIPSSSSSVHGFNQFVYCFNNPINLEDKTGNWPKWIKETAKWVNKNIVQPVVNFKKKVNKAKFDSIEVKAGVGMGLGIDISNSITAEFSRDTYIGLDDGKIILGNVVTTEVSFLDSDIKIGDTYDHLSEKGGTKMSTSGTPWDGPFDMIHYPDVVKGNELAIGPFVINNSGDLLVSVSASVHLGPGGFVSAGFNITEFFERIFE